MHQKYLQETNDYNDLNRKYERCLTIIKILQSTPCLATDSIDKIMNIFINCHYTFFFIYQMAFKLSNLIQCYSIHYIHSFVRFLFILIIVNRTNDYY